MAAAIPERGKRWRQGFRQPSEELIVSEIMLKFGTVVPMYGSERDELYAN
jgi:hypothetical protein